MQHRLLNLKYTSMILIDFSQSFHASIHILTKLNYEITEDNMRKVLLDFIKKAKMKFKDKGQVVLALDSKSWRSMYFKCYKHKRKKDRETSDIDYAAAFKCFDAIIEDLRDYFPYTVVQTLGAEGDDVIAVLSKAITEDTVIVARDKDFFQLHGLSWIKQYDPISETFIQVDTNKISRILFEHICKGDSTDGIPNILSKEDHFVNGEGRQKSISTKMLDAWYDMSEEAFSQEIGEVAYQRFKQNRNLIDLSKIPDKVQAAILEKYHTIPERKGTLHSYCIKKRLVYLMENMSDFV